MGIIYKTTNQVNGKWYIGKDEKNNPNYLGSGVLLTKAIKKYGKEYFKKEIIAECNNGKHELADLEKKIITETNAVADVMSYNIADGGKGGHTWGNYPNEHQLAIKLKMKKSDAEKESKRIFSIEHNLIRFMIDGRTAGRQKWWASLTTKEKSEYQRLRSSKTYKLFHNTGKEIITNNLQKTALEIGISYNYILCIKKNKSSKGWNFEIVGRI